MPAYQIISPRKRATQKGAFAPPRLVSQIAPRNRAGYQRTTRRAEREREARVQPALEKMDELIAILQRNNIPYGQWGNSVHLLAALSHNSSQDDSSQDNSSQDNSSQDNSNQDNSNDSGFNGGDFDCGEDLGTARDRRRDYGRFDSAKARSLDTEDSGPEDLLREKNQPVTGSVRTTERVDGSGAASGTVEKLKGHLERGGIWVRRNSFLLIVGHLLQSHELEADGEKKIVETRFKSAKDAD